MCWENIGIMKFLREVCFFKLLKEGGKYLLGYENLISFEGNF